jgi:hypothetical protein
LWSEERRRPVETGIRFHTYASLLKYRDQWPGLRSRIERDENEETAQKLIRRLQNLMELPTLSFMFDRKNKVLTERSLLSNEQFYRPDRVVIFPGGNVAVIDYKTGKQETEHRKQIENYARQLERAGFQVIKKILIYFDAAGDKPRVEEV